MSCSLNIKLFQFNHERKFEFPGKNLNQSEKRIYGEILRNHSLSAVFFILNNLRDRKQNISSYNRFLGLHVKIN